MTPLLEVNDLKKHFIVRGAFGFARAGRRNTSRFAISPV